MYKKQRNQVVKLKSQCKRDHFDRLNNQKDFKKPFWKNYKLYFSSKHIFGDYSIALFENGTLFTENNKIVKHSF